ncbi:MAG: TetR/AcrR family transcriptional regulator [Candidatus Ornithomonoglobus sp.]
MANENQRIMLTKRLLKEALLKLMAEKNIQKISVSELCQSAGINRSTFYKHYGSQYDVLRELEIDTVNKIEEVLEKKNPKNSIPKKVETMCEFFQENKAVSKILFQNNTANDEFANFLFNIPQMRDIYDMLPDRHDAAAKDLLMTFLINGSYSIIRKWLLEDCPKTPKEMGEMAYEVATRGWTS